MIWIGYMCLPNP